MSTDTAISHGDNAGDSPQEKAQEKAQQAAGKAREQVRAQVDQRSTDLGKQAGTAAEDLRGVAEHLRSQGKDQPAKAAEKVAERAETISGYLTDADGERILCDVEDFGRKRPWAFVAGGLAIGFAASRFLKASSSKRYRSSLGGSVPGSSSNGVQASAVPAAPLPPASTAPPVHG